MNFSSTMPMFACAYLYGYVDETGQNKQIDSELTYFFEKVALIIRRGPFSLCKLLELHFRIFWWRVKIYEIRLNILVFPIDYCELAIHGNCILMILQTILCIMGIILFPYWIHFCIIFYAHQQKLTLIETKQISHRKPFSYGKW